MLYSQPFFESEKAAEKLYIEAGVGLELEKVECFKNCIGSCSIHIIQIAATDGVIQRADDTKTVQMI